MAIIACPGCNNKVSDKVKECPHCGVSVSGADKEAIESARRQMLLQKHQRVQMLAFVAMLMFCGGFLYYYWQNVKVETVEYYMSIGAIVVGCVLYVITRIQLLLIKRKTKS